MYIYIRMYIYRTRVIVLLRKGEAQPKAAWKPNLELNLTSPRNDDPIEKSFSITREPRFTMDRDVFARDFYTSASLQCLW